MWPKPQFPTDLVTFTKEIFNGKLHFLYNVIIFQNCINLRVSGTRILAQFCSKNVACKILVVFKFIFTVYKIKPYILFKSSTKIYGLAMYLSKVCVLSLVKQHFGMGVLL